MSEDKKAETLCNLCGLPCTLGGDPYPDFRAGLISAVVQGGYESTAGNGYGALDDMTSYNFSLCEFCLDWLFSQFKIPVEVKDYMGSSGGYDFEDPNTKPWKPEPWKPAADRVNEDDWRKMKDEFFSEFNKRNEARK